MLSDKRIEKNVTGNTRERLTKNSLRDVPYGIGALYFGSTPAISSNRWKSLLRSKDDDRLSSDERSPSATHIAEVNTAMHMARHKKAIRRKINEIRPFITTYHTVHSLSGQANGKNKSETSCRSAAVNESRNKK